MPNTTNWKSSIQRFSKIATDPLRNFRFFVEFTTTGDVVGSPTGDKSTFLAFSGGFTQISGLNISTQGIQYREGGMNTTLHQIPGQTSFSPITLQRGVLYGKDEAINWMKQLFAAAAGEGIAGTGGQNFRCNLAIYVLDHPITADPLITANDVVSRKAYKMKFKVHNAWISSLNFSDLNAQDNQLMYETIQLVHEGLSVSFVE
jgi:phage tail-like protein